MKSNLDVTQLAFEYLRHNPMDGRCTEAQFLYEIEGLRAHFSELVELSPSELISRLEKRCGSSDDSNYGF